MLLFLCELFFVCLSFGIKGCSSASLVFDLVFLGKNFLAWFLVFLVLFCLVNWGGRPCCLLLRSDLLAFV